MTTRTRRIAAVGAIALLLIGLPVALLPHPEVWEHLAADVDYPRAALAAYRIAIGIHRPSGVPLNGVTYTFLIRGVSPHDIEVVFLPRVELQHVLPEAAEEAAEEIHVIVRRPTMAPVRWHFAE